MFKFEQKSPVINPYRKIDNFAKLTSGAGTDLMKMDERSMKYGDIWHFSKQDGTPIVEIDQSSNISFSADGTGKGKLIWPSGNYIQALGASMEINGNWLVLGGVRATSFTTRVGSTDYAGQSGTTRILSAIGYDGAQLRYKYRDVTFTGGVMTAFGNESDWNNVS